MTIKYAKLDREIGRLIATRRFEGGAYYVNKNPKSLLKPDSYYRRILAVLANSPVPLETLSIASKYNETYPSKTPKKNTSVNARLSELSTYGLVMHIDKNKAGGFWAVATAQTSQDRSVLCVAHSIDVNDGIALYKLATKNLAKLTHKANGKVAQE